jgi:hypothetical protein
MPATPPSLVLLRTFVRADERQTIFIVAEAGVGILLIEEAELWEEPRQDEGACYQYYPVVFPNARFDDLDAALQSSRKWFPWIEGAEKDMDRCAETGEASHLVGMHEG